MVMQEPEEIPDEGHERIVERVAAIDVAKVSGKVCTRTPHPQGGSRRVTKVWEVTATLAAVEELGDHLMREQIQAVTLESTGDYWRIWFYVLEERGLRVQLVNARDVKHAPGRPKTDRLDAVWLAKLTEKGLVRPSFVPPHEIRALRDYTRMRIDLIHERTRYWQRLEKLLEDALIKISSVSSTLNTLSTRAMLQALIAGERDPRLLAELAKGRLRVKIPALTEALNGRFDDHHGELAGLLLAQIDGLDAQIARLTARIEALITDMPDVRPAELNSDAHPDKAASSAMDTVARLDEIPGISPEVAQVILAEIGLDMTRFPTAGHLASWAKLSPQTIQSGTRSRGAAVGKGNPYLKGVLGTAAVVAGRTDTFLGERYRRIAKRRGRLRAVVAVGRSIMVIIWHLLSDPHARYRDLGSDYFLTKIDREKKARTHIRQLQALGFTVALTPAT
ncbi:IS110 family transposase [Nonomuraea zeae]|uniref:IS110 family transposase n=1 Tax=Nonomuraea zeae TaxID=1642303 RepID=A0A5S4G8Z5_9ACTN|nr:IS110 family transposase [Nonomuraea zeae]TMR29488.1 IS110 family transposase [Nonomuraea zeae]